MSIVANSWNLVPRNEKIMSCGSETENKLCRILKYEWCNDGWESEKELNDCLNECTY